MIPMPIIAAACPMTILTPITTGARTAGPPAGCSSARLISARMDAGIRAIEGVMKLGKAGPKARLFRVRNHHIRLNHQRINFGTSFAARAGKPRAGDVVQGRRRPAPHLPVKCRDREGKKAVARPPFSCPPLVTGCPLGVLQQIITRFRSSTSKGNPFDCALAHAVRSERWALGSLSCWKLLLRSSAL